MTSESLDVYLFLRLLKSIDENKVIRVIQEDICSFLFKIRIFVELRIRIFVEFYRHCRGNI